MNKYMMMINDIYIYIYIYRYRYIEILNHYYDQITKNMHIPYVRYFVREYVRSVGRTILFFIERYDM